MPLSLGKYYDQVALGRVFIGSTAAAGSAFPISTGTAVTFGVWNTDPNTLRPKRVFVRLVNTDSQ